MTPKQMPVTALKIMLNLVCKSTLKFPSMSFCISETNIFAQSISMLHIHNAHAWLCLFWIYVRFIGALLCIQLHNFVHCFSLNLIFLLRISFVAFIFTTYMIFFWTTTNPIESLIMHTLNNIVNSFFFILAVSSISIKNYSKKL